MAKHPHPWDDQHEAAALVAAAPLLEGTNPFVGRCKSNRNEVAILQESESAYRPRGQTGQKIAICGRLELVNLLRLKESGDKAAEVLSQFGQ